MINRIYTPCRGYGFDILTWFNNSVCPTGNTINNNIRSATKPNALRAIMAVGLSIKSEYLMPVRKYCFFGDFQSLKFSPFSWRNGPMVVGPMWFLLCNLNNTT